MKKILVTLYCLLLVSISSFAWRMPWVKKSVDGVIWDSCILYDMKEHDMYWGNPVWSNDYPDMYLQVESRGVDPNVGKLTYRIHGHTWAQKNLLNFVNLVLMDKRYHDVRMTDIKYNGWWDDVDLWFEGYGDFAIELIWDPHYQGFCY